MRIIRDMAQKTPKTPRACQRKVTWGEYLELAINQGPGLKPLVDVISHATGGWLGTRNTFAKLFDLEEPPLAATREYDRAYALLIAVGEQPDDWGVDEDLVSELLKRGRDLLIARSRCIELVA